MSYVRGPGVLHWHGINTISNGPYAFSAFASGAWPAANRAIYVPVLVPSRVIVKKLWYGNGTTATGNYDIGLYDSAGIALLRKGSTTKSTTGGDITWDCTDTTIGPGRYYLALASDSGTDTFTRANPASAIAAACGVLSEASAFALPATATWSVTASAYIPLIGMYFTTLVS